MKRYILIIPAVLILIAIYFIFLHDKAKRWSKEWEESYENFQPSPKIMDIIGLEKNMYVGEIGAGNGRFAVRVAKRVGNKGMVFANDIDLKAVRFMKRRCEREGISNMKVILSRVTNPYFPRNALDLVYVINTYEYFSDPVRLLANTRSSLRSEGKLAIVAPDPKKNKSRRRRNSIPKETILQQVSSAGYELVKMDTTSLIYDNVYIFKK